MSLLKLSCRGRGWVLLIYLFMSILKLYLVWVVLYLYTGFAFWVQNLSLNTFEVLRSRILDEVDNKKFDIIIQISFVYEVNMK